MNKTIFDFEELNDWHETNDFLIPVVEVKKFG